MQMVQQTIECAWFVRDYGKIKVLCKLHKILLLFISYIDSHVGQRMAKNGQNNQVETFKLKFNELRMAFQAEGTIEIELAVLRVADDLQGMKKDINDLGM